jgi:hypothetical protein
MNAEPTTVMGTLKPDGVLELDEKPNLPAGRVRVTLEVLAEPADPKEPCMARMESIWAGQRARGHVPRSTEEVEAERRALREEAEEEIRECERIHKEAEQGHRDAKREDRPTP